MITFGLLVVGGLNWGLTAFGYNLVEKIFGSGSALEMLVYVLVAVSALYEVFTHKQNCKSCNSGAQGQM